MSLILKEGGDFKPCPEGVHHAVCVDVFEIKDSPTSWGLKDIVRVVWETDAMMDNGRPFLINSWNMYTPSLSPKSNLRKHLKSWRGKDFTKEELAGFDIEKLIGASCQLVIEHNEGKNGNTYANISAIIKAEKKLAPTGKYIRMKDREDAPVKAAKANDLEESDIPFD